MDNMELFYPEIQVHIGEYIFSRGISVTISSSKGISNDWGKVTFSKEFFGKIFIPEGEPVSVMLGYDNNLQEVFSGYVTNGYNGASDENEILFKDKMLLLERTTVTHTFLEATPQDIIRYGLLLSGISDYSISSAAYPEKDRVSVVKKNVVGILNQINAAWGIHIDGFFLRGIFYWGERPEQESIYELEYGVNIISLERMNGRWQLETVSLPFLQHSQQIQVTHPYINGTFEIKKLLFTTNEAGFIRTKIFF